MIDEALEVEVACDIDMQGDAAGLLLIDDVDVTGSPVTDSQRIELFGGGELRVGGDDDTRVDGFEECV